MEKYKVIIENFPNSKIAVIGDMVADVYLYGKPHKLSREAPVVVIKHEAEQILPGSAANTVHNLARLGAKVYPIGVVGGDREGKFITDYFKGLGLDISGCLMNPKGQTITKTRIMAGDYHTSKQQVIRIDKEPDKNDLQNYGTDILKALKGIEESLDALIVSDYGYNFFSPETFNLIRKIAQKKLVVVDSHARLLEFKGATVITPNEAEAELATGIKLVDEKEVIKAGFLLLKKGRYKAVLLTRGNKGMILFEKGKEDPLGIPVFGADEVTDVTGAGDTVVSVLTLSLVSGATFYEAAQLSNYAASIVVMKRGTATLSREELFEVLENEKV